MSDSLQSIRVHKIWVVSGQFEYDATLMLYGPLAGKTEKVQCAYLLIWVGDRGHETLVTFDMPVAAVDKITAYI